MFTAYLLEYRLSTSGKAGGSLHSRVDIAPPAPHSGANPASYPVGTEDTPVGCKEAGAGSKPLTSIYCRIKKRGTYNSITP